MFTVVVVVVFAFVVVVLRLLDPFFVAVSLFFTSALLFVSLLSVSETVCCDDSPMVVLTNG